MDLTRCMLGIFFHVFVVCCFFSESFFFEKKNQDYHQSIETISPDVLTGLIWVIMFAKVISAADDTSRQRVENSK